MMTIGDPRTIWTEQCDATAAIKERFGLKSALDYLITEKLFTFAKMAMKKPEFADELPNFMAEIRTIFTPSELTGHFEMLRLGAHSQLETLAASHEFAGEAECKAARKQRLDILCKSLLEEPVTVH